MNLVVQANDVGMSIMVKYNNVIQKDRIFEIRGQWYFNTWEGIEGPYPNRLQAKNKLNVYLGIFGNLNLADRSTPVGSEISKPKHALFPTQMQWR